MKLVASCYINREGVSVNGNSMFRTEAGTEDWKKDIYRSLEVDYPKFHKMDALAKMAFLGVESLQHIDHLDNCGEDGLALIFANRYASYDTDMRFIDSYEDKGNPSPSLFVYTLPNILTGELSIRHKWYGENIFFILEKFDPAFFEEQINFYFSRGAAACLCGWVESENEHEECALFLVEPGETALDKTELLNVFKHGKNE